MSDRGLDEGILIRVSYLTYWRMCSSSRSGEVSSFPRKARETSCWTALYLEITPG